MCLSQVKRVCHRQRSAGRLPHGTAARYYRTVLPVDIRQSCRSGEYDRWPSTVLTFKPLLATSWEALLRQQESQQPGTLTTRTRSAYSNRPVGAEPHFGARRVHRPASVDLPVRTSRERGAERKVFEETRQTLQIGKRRRPISFARKFPVAEDR